MGRSNRIKQSLLTLKERDGDLELRYGIWAGRVRRGEDCWIDTKLSGKLFKPSMSAVVAVLLVSQTIVDAREDAIDDATDPRRAIGCIKGYSSKDFRAYC